MLQKDRRIQKKEFFDILKSGSKKNSSHFTLYFTKLPENNNKKSRFSFSVSKKVAKNAVVRNKIRRRGYSILNKYLQAIKNSHYFIFVAKKGAEVENFLSLEKEITNLLSDFYI